MDYGNTLRLLDCFQTEPLPFMPLNVVAGNSFESFLSLVNPVCVCMGIMCIYPYDMYLYLFIYLFIYNISIYMLHVYIYTQYILLSRIQHLYNLVHALEETPRWAFEVEETTGCTEGGTVSASWQKKMVSHAYCWRFRNPHLSPPWMFFEIPSKQWEYLSYQPLQNFWTRSSTVSYL